MPLVVRAVDSNGAAIAGVPVFWSLASGQGNLVAPVAKTDSNGFAMTDFMAAAVPMTASFVVQTITATSPAGSATFTVTTLAAGATPLVDLLAPAGTTGLSGASGDTLPGALKVMLTVAGGPQDGTPLSSVSVRLADANSPGAPPAAVCANSQTGEALTDATGTASCDITLAGPPGSYSLSVMGGGQPAVVNFPVTVKVAATCTYVLAPGAASYGAGGGSGTLYISTAPACSWTASSNGDWLGITSSAGGIGPAWVSYTAAANGGPPRTAAIDVAGQMFTVSQDATGTPASLAITTPAPLPDGSTQQHYSTMLTAAGGTPPYSWSVQGALPPGLSLDAAAGSISGPPLIAGTTTFQITVTDNAGATASLSFSITIEGFNGGVPGAYPALTNASVPPGGVGMAYLQTLTPVGGCTGPLSPDPAFTVSAGALPPGLAVREISPRVYAIAGVPGGAGTFAFTLAITDACGRTGHASLSITVSSSAGATGPISASPTSAQFTVQQFDTTSPPDQSIALTISTAVSYVMSLAPGTGGNWLSAAGGVPGAASAITLHVANYATLDPGTYSAAVVINLSGGGPPLVVPVTLTVKPSVIISASPANVTLTVAATAAGGTTTTQTIAVQAAQPVAYSLTATVQSGGGWLSLSKASGTAGDTFDIIANGASLAPGTYTGTVTIAPTTMPGPPQNIAVTLVVTTSDEVMPWPGTIAVVYRDGDPQPAAQSISLSTVSGGPEGISVSSDAPWVTVTPNATSAPATFSITVDPMGLDPGAHYASIVVSSLAAASGRMSIPVTLFLPTPKPVIQSVQNAASFASGSVAPGEAVVIYGSNLGPPFLVSGTVANGVQSTGLGGVQITFNKTAAPILYVSDNVVAAMVPFSVAAAAAVTLQVSLLGQQSDPFSLTAAATAPGIFTSGNGQAIAVNPDGSLNGPGHGASAGDTVGIYITGGGVTSPSSKDGQFAAGTTPALAQPVSAQVNGVPSTVVSSGSAPGLVAGVSLIQVQIPAGVPAGAASVAITVGGVSTQPGVSVYIGP
jgi:uncharacterized protein (TIGR03437 family)